MSLSIEFQVIAEMPRRFEALTAEWHVAVPAVPPDDGLRSVVVSLHAANFGLWHCEDQARRHDAPDAQIVRYKRAIDRLNVRRNRAIEEIDRRLVSSVEAAPDAEPCSDTPGAIVDRLSVLSLRRFHTARPIRGHPTDPAREAQLHVIELQRRDLTRAFEVLLDSVAAGRRRFHVYQQFKRIAPEYCPSSDSIDELVTRVVSHERRDRHTVEEGQQ